MYDVSAQGVDERMVNVHYYEDDDGDDGGGDDDDDDDDDDVDLVSFLMSEIRRITIDIDSGPFSL